MPLSFLTAQTPVFSRKPPLPNPEELPGLLRLHWEISGRVILDTYYTRLDQSLALWGTLTAVIFLTAQLSHLAWIVQALAWSTLTLMAIAMTFWLAWPWATVKQFRWVIYLWSLLMLSGICLTDYGIFRGSGIILSNLCPGWLSLCALGYWLTGVGIHALALIGIGFVHLGAIPLLALFPGGQFSVTGSVMAGSLWVLAVWQWRHR
jgi:hypothetical protein